MLGEGHLHTKSVTISLFGTCTESLELEAACARESGRRSRNGIYVAKPSMRSDKITAVELTS